MTQRAHAEIFSELAPFDFADGMCTEHITAGCTATTFCPNGTVTRAERRLGVACSPGGLPHGKLDSRGDFLYYAE